MKNPLYYPLFLVSVFTFSQNARSQYCYEDKLNNNCASAVHDLFEEFGSTIAVESCGDCPGPTPEVPNPVCPTAGKKEYVADPLIEIIFAWRIDPKKGAKDDVTYHTAIDCGLQNTCKTNCIVVILQNGVRYKCDKELLDESLPIPPRTADGHKCVVFE